MSTTQTDLSNLFEKRRSQTSPQSRDKPFASDSQPPRSSTSISTPVRSSASSHPFRSLNDLLGIRKTPIGHLVSPYEERHGPPAPAPEPERATKRAKISTGSTTSNVPSVVVDLTGPENGPLRQCAPVRETIPPKDSTPTMPPPPEKPVAVARPPSPSVPIPIQPTPRNSTANHAPLPGSTAQDERPGQPTARNQQKDKSPAVTDDTHFEKPAAPRMTMQKPRNKFMYSTLQQQPSSVPSKPDTEKQRRLPLSKPTDFQLVRPKLISKDLSRSRYPVNNQFKHQQGEK